MKRGKLFEHNGRKQTVREWATELGISEGGFRTRMRKSNDPEYIFAKGQLPSHGDLTGVEFKSYYRRTYGMTIMELAAKLGHCPDYITKMDREGMLKDMVIQ